MRLRQLALLRYGHLSDAVLDLPDRAALCVVHGANEAGKSTTLAAIGDALFGFGHRSAYDFLHGGPQLRLGFTVVGRDGREASFQRRKGRSGTLRDAGDAVLPEAALQAFLGGASRETFERGFGLDGERLRQGGASLAAGGGGLGESLFAAGTGLLGLRGALSALDEEAKALVGDGRGRRRMNEAIDNWRQAQRQIEELAVLPRTWQAAEREHAEAVDALGALQGEAARLNAEANRLQRVRRVAPLLAGLDQARTTLLALGEVPALPEDAGQQMRDAAASGAQATADARREEAEAQRLTAARAQLPRDPAILAMQDTIARLAEQRPLAVQAEADLPVLRLRVEGLRAVIAEAGTALGWPVTPDALGQAVPDAAARRAVHKLLPEHAALKARAAAAGRELAAAHTRLAQAEAALPHAQPAKDPALLRATIEQVRGEGRVEMELAQTANRLGSLRAAAAIALRALPLWQGDAAALAACPLPLPQAAENAAATLARSVTAWDAAQAALETLAKEIHDAEEALAREADGETMPTPAAIQAARQERDAAWRELRRILEGGAAEAPPTPDRFETLRDQADRLADRRADEAHRVAAWVLATDRLRLLRARRQQAEAALTAAEQRRQAAEAAWQALWAPSGIHAAAPADMAQWQRARADVLRQASDAAEASLLHENLAARREAALARLRACLPGLEAESLAAALTHADVACARAEASHRAHQARLEAMGTGAGGAARAGSRRPGRRDGNGGLAGALGGRRRRAGSWGHLHAGSGGGRAGGLGPDRRSLAGMARWHPARRPDAGDGGRLRPDGGNRPAGRGGRGGGPRPVGSAPHPPAGGGAAGRDGGRGAARPNCSA
jgi:chromosome segregation protein